MKKHLKRLLALTFVLLLIGWGLSPLIVYFSQSRDPYLVDNMVKVEIYDQWGSAGTGSGFLYEDGRIMTAGHVVEDANHFTIVYSDGTEESASAYKSSRYDIGIIYVDRECENPVSWNISPLDPGTTVFTQGYPEGMDVLRLSKGIVSSVEWTTYIWPTIITVDAAGRAGNSGGPLLDKRGRVCGMVAGGIGRAVLCVPGRLLFEFMVYPDREDHEKEDTYHTEVAETVRQNFFTIH